MSCTTEHSLLRIEQHLKVNSQFARNIIENGIRRGKTIECFKSQKVKKWMAERQRDGCYAVIYNELCLIVSGYSQTCVTAYPVPYHIMLIIKKQEGGRTVHAAWKESDGWKGRYKGQRLENIY